MNRSGRVIGVALASAILGWLVSSLILFVVSYLVGGLDRRGTGEAIGISVVIIVGSLPAALLSTLTLGLLWHAHASRRRLRKKSDYWLTGLMIGGAVAVIAPFIDMPGMDLSWAPLIAVGGVYGAACGGLTGLFAWLMLRPDQDALQSASANAQATAPYDGLPPGPLRPWAQAVSLGLAVVVVVIALWITLASPRP